ncbi:MAG TPA: hypothetical protein DC038_03630 [Clostridiales bacterium]|nr:hypothetical protein [Clostridiales bacterium]
MYPVTELFKQKIKETTRMFRFSLTIYHSAGTLVLEDKDVVLGSMQLIENSQSGEDFNVGGVVASTFSIDINNKTDGIDGQFIVDNLNIIVDDMLRPVDWYEDYTGINFEGAILLPQVGLLLDEDNDIWEYVPLGRFIVDDVTKRRNYIRLKAMDGMIGMDKAYTVSKLGYPASLYQIYVDICNLSDVAVGTVNFTNMNYVVDERPSNDYTLRDIISAVAALSGTFAQFSRTGALELKWYGSTHSETYTGSNRFNFIHREDLIRISGITYEDEENVYLVGSDDYVVDLTDNPLLQNNRDTAMTALYDKVKNTVFTPYESKWQGNPAIQPGDRILQIDRDGNEFDTIVTYSSYKYRGSCNLAAKGQPVKAKQYTGSTAKKIAEIKRKMEEEVGGKLTSLEQAQLNATTLIANMLGGYAVNADDAFYIADNPDINIAKKVWKWGLGGFGYSENGKDGPYETAITADGSIVAMLVAANIITANMIETGILTSRSGNMAIDLDHNIMRIADNLGHNRVLLGEYKLNTFGIQIKDAANNRTLLDESGLLNSWQQNMTDNFDSNHPAKLKFYLPPNAGEFITLNLSFSLDQFRNYVKPEMIYMPVGRLTSAWPAVSWMYTGSAAGPGTHSHEMNIQHSHSYDITHSHQLTYAVYEVGTPADVGIKIDGVDRTESLGGPWDGQIEISDLNVKPYITANGWHTIEFFMPEVEDPAPLVLGRVTANIFGMIFMYAPE